MPDRRRKKNPKRNQLCLRLTDHQLELLRRYADHRHFDNEVDAIRKMIDGLEDWLARQAAKENLGSTQVMNTSPPPTGYSGLPASSDVAPSDASITKSDESITDEESSLGDFGGRPSIGLPNPSWTED